jgi:chromosome segregation ATPase
MRAERDALAERLAVATDKLATVSESLASAGEERQALASQVAASEDARAALLARLTDSSADRERYREQLTAAESERDLLRARLAEVQPGLVAQPHGLGSGEPTEPPQAAVSAVT